MLGMGVFLLNSCTIIVRINKILRVRAGKTSNS